MFVNRYHHLGWHFGIDFFEAAFSDQTFGRHAHEGFAIGAIAEGTGGYVCRGRSMVLPAGSLSLMNPEEPHTGYSPARCVRYNMLYVSENAARAIMGLTELRGFSTIAPTDKGFGVTRALSRVARMLNSSKRPDWKMGIEEAVHEVLTRAFVGYGKAELKACGNEPASVSFARNRIAQVVEAGSDLTLEQLARDVGLNASYFIRSFKRTTGMTPHAYIMQARVDYARHLLLLGMPAAQAATTAGFYDQAHFVQRFRLTYGVTPGALRRH